MKLVTPSALIERLKVNGSLARASLRYLEKVSFPPLTLCHPLSRLMALSGGKTHQG
jgi:hypothetical protein